MLSKKAQMKNQSFDQMPLGMGRSAGDIASQSRGDVHRPQRAQPYEPDFVMNPQQGSSTYIPGQNSSGLAGQQINVVTNNNIHLSLKEWMIRGTIGGIGNAFAWPFRLAASVLSGLFHSVIGFVKIAFIIVLAPTLLWLGIKLQDELSAQNDVSEGTAIIVDHAKEVGNGIQKGVNR